MELLEQCKEWNNNEEYQKVVDALEILPESILEAITDFTSELLTHIFILKSTDLPYITLSRLWMQGPEMKTPLI